MSAEAPANGPVEPATLPPARPTGYAFANATRVFRHRNYRLWFTGQTVSLIGTWMQQVAQGWLVLLLTDDPFLLGVTVAAQFVPVLVLGLFGGLVADALPKRRTLMATQAAQMVLAFVLYGLVATDTPRRFICSDSPEDIRSASGGQTLERIEAFLARHPDMWD